MSRIGSIIRATAPLALLAAAGCAQNFDAKVSRFQQMPAAQGQTFAIKAGDPKLDGGLEFANYAQLISSKLTQVGYRPVATGDAPNLVVSVSYDVDKGREKVRSNPDGGFGRCFGWNDPWCGGFGFWGHPYGGRFHGFYPGFYDPFLFGPGGFDGVESYTVYTSELAIKIEHTGGERVFEGKAQAQSLNDNLTYLVPNLIEAMFTGFPGSSGETVKITVPPPPKKSGR
jgi:hypothetical protein